MKSICEATVRYAETDQMGVVYHSNYFVWFEIGRTTLLKEMGYSYKRLESENIMMPVINVGCRYIEAAKYDDILIIEATIHELKASRITFEYKVYRKRDDKLLSTGTTTHAFVNKEFKPINFKKNFPQLYTKLQEAVTTENP